MRPEKHARAYMLLIPRMKLTMAPLAVSEVSAPQTRAKRRRTRGVVNQIRTTNEGVDGAHADDGRAGLEVRDGELGDVEAAPSVSACSTREAEKAH